MTNYVAIAMDYDGTIAHDGVVDQFTVAALQRLRACSRRVVLVTGRELPDLQRVMSRLDLFDLVVAENGALLYRPDIREERPPAEPPPQRFLERLRTFALRGIELKCDALSFVRGVHDRITGLQGVQMTKMMVLVGSAVFLALTSESAGAAGCLSGAAVGGVAGHMAGHHGVLGAAAGCAVGHHEAKKHARANAAAQTQASPNQASPSHN
jgi:haloacid dehalogenase-like hydrolase